MNGWIDTLLGGPLRYYKDEKEKQLVVETTKHNPAGAGIEVCRLKEDRYYEARGIMGLPDFLKAIEPFAALGRQLAGQDGDAPLISDPGVKLEITVGDAQRAAEACAKMLPPIEQQAGHMVRLRQKRKFRPG